MDLLDCAGECLLDRRLITEEEHSQEARGDGEARACCQPDAGKRLRMQARLVVVECLAQRLEGLEAHQTARIHQIRSLIEQSRLVADL